MRLFQQVQKSLYFPKTPFKVLRSPPHTISLVRFKPRTKFLIPYDVCACLPMTDSLLPIEDLKKKKKIPLTAIPREFM